MHTVHACIVEKWGRHVKKHEMSKNTINLFILTQIFKIIIHATLKI